VAKRAKADWQEHLRMLAAKRGRAGSPAAAPQPAPAQEAKDAPQAAEAAPEEPKPQAAPQAEAPKADDSMRSKLIKPLSEDVHEEPRHDAPGRQVKEVGGLKIIHSEGKKKPS
jgi:hypothetical protein